MKKGKHAFTIVEMLLVIGLLALIAGLLSPALNSARQTAKTAACAANLRQVGVALMNYSMDNAGFFPIPAADDGLDGGWMESLWVYGGYESNSYVSATFDETYQSKNQNIFLCPVTSRATKETDRNPYRVDPTKNPDPNSGNMVDEKCSYGMNVMPQYMYFNLKNAAPPAPGPGGKDPDKVKHKGRRKSKVINPVRDFGSEMPAGRNVVSNPGQTALVLENCQLQVLPDMYFDNTAFFPHRNGANVLFFDGHIELLNRQTITTLYPNAPDPMLAPFWTGQ